MTPLEKALAKSSIPPVAPLVFVHLTRSRHLKRFIRSKQLAPAHCKVFGEKLLYFSYGSPFFRPKDHQTEDELEFPIAFVFDESILPKLKKFFPFDTGGMAKGLFGQKWKKEFIPLEDFHVTANPERLVACFYESNENYLHGIVRKKDVPREAPIPLLHSFLSANLSKRGADRRQRTVECISDESLQLLDSLVWIGYPQIKSAQIHQLWLHSRRKFRSKPYVATVNDNPSALVSTLAQMVFEEFQYLHKGPR